MQEQELSVQSMQSRLEQTLEQAEKERKRQGEQIRKRDAEKNALNEEIARLMHNIAEVKAELADRERQIQNSQKDSEVDRLKKALDNK